MPSPAVWAYLGFLCAAPNRGDENARRIEESERCDLREDREAVVLKRGRAVGHLGRRNQQNKKEQGKSVPSSFEAEPRLREASVAGGHEHKVETPVGELGDGAGNAPEPVVEGADDGPEMDALLPPALQQEGGSSSSSAPPPGGPSDQQLQLYS